jgi:hypothetical protein
MSMMERYKGYWISGGALPGPPYMRYWESVGCVLKDGRSGSLVEVGRIQDPGITIDLAVVAFSLKPGSGQLWSKNHPSPARYIS